MEVHTISNLDYKIMHIGDLSFNWIVKNLEYFDVNHSINKNLRVELKTFIELVFLTNYLTRTTIWKKDNRLNDIILFIKTILENQKFEEIVISDPDGLPGIAILEEFIILNSYEGRSFNHLLRKYREYKITTSFQKIPFRLMDLKYSYERANIDSNLPSYSTLYSQTVAGKEAPVPYLNTMDIYSITHVIFYLTDMGFRLIDKYLTLDQQKHLHTLVRKSLATSIRHNNLDTMSELLMCSSFLNIDENNILYKSSWEYLYNSQKPEGNVPSPTFFDNKYNFLNDSKENVFINCYHTTLVVLGAVTSWLSNKKEDYRKW
jgi:hypothetical protein